ncbi:PREDICTED: vomeromodulin-like [Galeopterus variegatus]|uniref:Vomeromodulin-like n=1 Tax=Galeopterus variegatus TaxID=482537 RepID=A0ABM0RP18_GALVR|nr:PREDICTED: vomeromodulin-like [Galeopterus variegatus]
MLILWAMAITLAIEARALDLLNQGQLLGNLPVPAFPVPILNNLSICMPRKQSSRSLPIPEKLPLRKQTSGAAGGRCQPVAKYFISNSKLKDYLNATLLPQIEMMLKCEKVNMAGVLGTLLSTVGDSGLLSVLDITSSLDILGSGGLGSILGKRGSSKSLKLPLSEVTGAISNLLPLGQEGLGSLLPTGAHKNPVKGLLDSTGLSNFQLPLNDVANKIGELKESTESVLNSALSPDVNEALTALLGNINLEELLLGLMVQKVTVESMKLTMEGNEIHVDAKITAFIGGKGIIGPVLSILGFQVEGDVSMKIGISTDNTQCVNLLVQEKAIKAKKVDLQIVQTVTESLPIPLYLPLDDIIAQLLTVIMNENIEEPNSCAIILDDFNDCENSTGLFTYYIKSSRISEEGLSTLYCAKANFNKNTVPVPGSSLPPDPKNANISITLSHTLLRAIVTYIVKQSSVKKNNLDVSVSRIAYAYQPGNKVQATYWVSIRKDGKCVATGQTNLTLSYDTKISKNKLTSDIRLFSSENSVTPPEAMHEVQDVMAEVLKKLYSGLAENIKQWNIPPGVISSLLKNAKVLVLQTRDLQAAN